MQVLKKKEREEVPEKDDRHSVLLKLDKDDYDKLRILVRETSTNNNEVLRQCLRHVFDVEMTALRGKGGAA